MNILTEIYDVAGNFALQHLDLFAPFLVFMGVCQYLIIFLPLKKKIIYKK